MNALQLADPVMAIGWLKKMISHAPEYYSIDDDTLPILIYHGSDDCYGVPQLFTDELAKALHSCQQRIEVFDMAEGGSNALMQLFGRRFKAVIGIQCSAFSFMTADGIKFHDLIVGPKYDIVLDHPIGMKDYADNVPRNYYLLSHDRNYLSFANRYYKKIKGTFYFPPAGTYVFGEAGGVPVKKQYDVTFIGSYRDYRTRLATMYALPRTYRFLCARLIHIIRQSPNDSAETALQKVLQFYDITLSDSEFVNLFYGMRVVYSCIASYYREKVVCVLLDAGVSLHVYGDSWEKAPFAGNSFLVRHPALNVAESLWVMRQSRISLNIMTWHKDGLTERILNAMLCCSAVLSDRSTRLEEDFTDGEDILLFDLARLEALPSYVKSLLASPGRLDEIAKRGFRRATEKHLWIHRARELLSLIHECT